ncbi:hypothetical protein ACS386_06380 [Flavobacteriaceae bacterium LMO-SS05]
MIKFFRNIRQKLLEQGKTTNYLKYALCEIIKRPIRDYISVANCRIVNQRAFRYAI